MPASIAKFPRTSRPTQCLSGTARAVLVQVFRGLRLWQEDPGDQGGSGGNASKNGKGRELADALKDEARYGDAQRGGDGGQGDDGTAGEIEAASAGGEVGDHEDGHHADDCASDAAQHLCENN